MRLICSKLHFSYKNVVLSGYVNNCVEHSSIVLRCLLDCALEYTIDDRGDVGVWVREAAINSLEVCTTFCCIN